MGLASIREGADGAGVPCQAGGCLGHAEALLSSKHRQARATDRVFESRRGCDRKLPLTVGQKSCSSSGAAAAVWEP